MIPFNRASLGSREYEFISRAINNGHISGSGPFTKLAESRLEELHGNGKSLLTTSCTHALELASRLLELGPEDEVIVPSFTFVSSAAAFMLSGARPVFADVREDTLNLCPESVRGLISNRTKAVCVVHYAGVGADPLEFRKICDDHGLALVEDNAHGLGGRSNGAVLGTFGDLSTLSFHETKNVTCGEGGALHVNREDLFERAEILREKGTNRARFFRGQVDKYTWVDVGSSWVLSDLLAAVLSAQLERFDEIQMKRGRIWNSYFALLQDWAHDNHVRLPFVPPESEHTSHMFYLRMPSLEARSRFIDHMNQHGVQTVFHYQPLHLSNVGLSLGGVIGQCPNSEAAADDLVRLPLFEGLDDTETERIITAVKSFVVNQS